LTSALARAAVAPSSVGATNWPSLFLIRGERHLLAVASEIDVADGAVGGRDRLGHTGVAVAGLRRGRPVDGVTGIERQVVGPQP
jgi:hypothetical protein